MADCYVPPHPRSFFFRSCLFVRSTTSPAMADCYVPPHPRFRLSVVRRSFVVCFSFVCRLFVVRLLFVRRSFIIRLSFVRSFVRSFIVRSTTSLAMADCNAKAINVIPITAHTLPVPECLGGLKAIHLCPPYCSYPTELPAGGHHRQIMLWDGKTSYASYKFLRRKIGEGWAVEFLLFYNHNKSTDGPTFDDYIIATVHQTASRQVTSARPHHRQHRIVRLWIWACRPTEKTTHEQKPN